MRIWLIKEGEPLPIAENPRLMRTGLMAEYLDQCGHIVTWFSSTFDHGKKKYYFYETKRLNVFNKTELILIHSSIAYQKNVSLKRILYHQKLGNQFKKLTATLPKPDVILCAYPTMQFAKQAINYGKTHDVPVILDIRDLWPDIFERGMPKIIQKHSDTFLAPLRYDAGKIIKEATGLIAIMPSHLSWALKRAGRKKTWKDQVIHIGYKTESLSTIILTEELKRWKDLGITDQTWNICFIGTMSKGSLDLKTAIEGFLLLVKKYDNMRLILCGTGDGYEEYCKFSAHCSQIIFPGWIDKKQMISLMKLSKAGLYPYRNLMDFKDSITNKMIGYMSEKLPVATSLTGYALDYITKYEMGVGYEENNAQDFFRTMERLYLNEPMRNRMGENAYHCFCKDFDSKKINKILLDYLLEMVQSYYKFKYIEMEN